MIILAIEVVLIGIFIWVFILTWDANADSLLKPNDTGIVGVGEQIYSTQCTSCHGKNLEGQPEWRRLNKDGLLPAPPHDENGHTWHHTDILLFELTKFGLAKISGLKNHKTNMPAYDGVLTDKEIIAVLSYIKSKWPAEIRERHDKINAQN